jgi:antitoxin ParD1/3/4
MTKTSVALGDHFQAFAARPVAEGRYGSVSEAVRAGMRLLEQQEYEAKARALLAAIAEGEASGFAEAPFDFDGFVRRMRETHGA